MFENFLPDFVLRLDPHVAYGPWGLEYRLGFLNLYRLTPAHLPGSSKNFLSRIFSKIA